MTNIWPKIFVMGYGDNARESALTLAMNLRRQIFNQRESLRIQPMPSIEVCLDGNIKKQLGRANKEMATHVVIMKDAEKSVIKNMQTGEQEEIPSVSIADEFCRLMQERYL